MLGICFAGQLISKALGGEVTPAPSMQIGWHHTTLTEHAMALFKSKNGLDGFSAFEWHGDTFSLSDSALRLFIGENRLPRRRLMRSGAAQGSRKRIRITANTLEDTAITII